MHLRTIYWFVVIQALVTPSAGQKEAANWYFGHSTGITFTTNPPQAFIAPTTFHSYNRNSAISDENGNILFYSTMDVYNKNHLPLYSQLPSTANNGDGQDIFLKKPGTNNLFYRFKFLNAILHYDVIDISVVPTGSVISYDNPVSSVAQHNTYGIAVTKHCNGIDYWIVSHHTFANIYYSFLFTSNGVAATPVTSTVGSTHLPSQAQIKFSPNGKFLATAVNSNSNGVFSHFELFNFNRSTGVVSNCVQLNYFPSYRVGYGVEFSPDNSKLYGSYYGSSLNSTLIYQWNLCAGSASAIAASAFTVAATPSRKYRMQLGIDGKIYVIRIPLTSNSSYSSTLAVIGNPDLPGSACNYAENGLSLGTGSVGDGLANFPSNYFATPLPPASFNINLQAACRTVTFTAPSTFTTACAASSYSLTQAQWTFGDPLSGNANQAGGLNPVHQFSGPGTYTVKVKLIYECGSDSSLVVVPVTGPSYAVVSSAATCSAQGSASTSVTGGTGPFSYTWFPSGSNSGNPSNLLPGTNTVQIYDAGEQCLNTATVHVGTDYNMAAAVSVTNLSCFNSNDGVASVTVTGGSGAYAYSWSNTSQTNPVATNLAGGMYTVNIKDLAGPCESSQTFSLSVPPGMNVTIHPVANNACVGEKITLGSSASGGSPPYSYQWFNGAATTTAVATSSVNGTQSCFLTVTDAKGCTETATEQLTFSDAPPLSVPNATICEGNTVALFVSGASSATWMPIGVSGTNAVTAPTANTSYTVFCNQAGCLSTYSIVCLVSLVPPPSVIVSLSSSSICSKTDFEAGKTLTVHLSGAATYSISTPFGLLCSAPNSPTSVISSNLNQEDTVMITISGSNAYCATSIFKKIAVIQSPSVQITGNLGGQCVPFCRSLTFSASQEVKERTCFLWLNDRKTPIDLSEFCIRQAGDHTISFVATNSAGCSFEAKALISAFPKPTAGFTWYPEKPTELTEPVYFEAQPHHMLKYHWEYPANERVVKNDQEHFYATFVSAGIYPVALTVENEFSCRDTAIAYVEVQEDFAVYMPNAFTPNGDGKNDVLFPVLRGADKVSFEIFNRWGVRLFSSNDESVGWDGTFEGQPCKEDQYVWKLNFSTKNPNNRQPVRSRTGNVLLYY